ncbi:MAG: Putative sortase (Surface protein transpeptidase), partial [uncultured Nocardioidaceae bacterium]
DPPSRRGARAGVRAAHRVLRGRTSRRRGPGADGRRTPVGDSRDAGPDAGPDSSRPVERGDARGGARRARRGGAGRAGTAPLLPQRAGAGTPLGARGPLPRQSGRRGGHAHPGQRPDRVTPRPRWRRRAGGGRQLPRHRSPHVALRAVPRPAHAPPRRPGAGAVGGHRLRLPGDGHPLDLLPVAAVAGRAVRGRPGTSRRRPGAPGDHPVHLRDARGPRGGQLLVGRARQPRAPHRQGRCPGGGAARTCL